MNEVEKNLFKDTVKAFTPEETLEAVRLISDDVLWDELIRRNTAMSQEICRIEDILGVSLDNLHPIPVGAWEDIKNRYDDMSTKFRKIKKGIAI